MEIYPSKKAPKCVYSCLFNQCTHRDRDLRKSLSSVPAMAISKSGIHPATDSAHSAQVSSSPSRPCGLASSASLFPPSYQNCQGLAGSTASAFRTAQAGRASPSASPLAARTAQAGRTSSFHSPLHCKLPTSMVQTSLLSQTAQAGWVSAAGGPTIELKAPLFSSADELVNFSVKLGIRLILSKFLPPRSRLPKKPFTHPCKLTADVQPQRLTTLDLEVQTPCPPELQPESPPVPEVSEAPVQYPHTLFFTGKQGAPVAPVLLTSICKEAVKAEMALHPSVVIRVDFQLSKTGVGTCLCADQLSYIFILNILGHFSCNSLSNKSIPFSV
jgi:hypothetical protein